MTPAPPTAAARYTTRAMRVAAWLERRGDPLPLLDAVLLGGAAWTVADNAAYLLHQSLFVATCGAAVLAGALAWGWRRVPDTAPDGESAGATDAPAPPRWVRVLWVVAALAVVALWLGTRRVTVFWLGAVLVLGGNVFWQWRSGEARRNGAGAPGRTRPLWLGAICIVAVYLAMTTHRPDTDDTYYLNRAAVAADDFFGPLPHTFTVFAGDVPSPYPTYGLTAYHDFLGLLSRVLDSEPIAIASFVITPVASVLLILAYAALLRALTPRAWPWCLLAVVALLFIDGSYVQNISNHAFVRIWQGKALLLHLWLPLLLLHGFRYGADGGARNAVRLAAGETAALGLSSVGLWMAPVVGCTAVLAGAFGRRALVRRTLLAVVCCAYPLVVGAVAYGQSLERADQRYREPAYQDDTWYRNPDRLMTTYFGSVDGAAFWLGASVLAGVVAPDRRFRRFSAVAAFVLWTTFLNPHLASYVARYVTSATVYWRTLWLLPLMVMAAGVLAAGFNAPRPWGAWLGPVVLVLGVAAQARWITTTYVLSSENFAWRGPPALKVPAQEYAIAAFLTDVLPAGSAVVAPPDLAWIFPMFREHLYPLAPKDVAVTLHIGRRLGRAHEAEDRIRATQYVDGHAVLEPAEFRRILREFDVRGVVVERGMVEHSTIAETLKRAGFQLARADRYYLTYVRPPGA